MTTFRGNIPVVIHLFSLHQTPACGSRTHTLLSWNPSASELISLCCPTTRRASRPVAANNLLNPGGRCSAGSEPIPPFSRRAVQCGVRADPGLFSEGGAVRGLSRPGRPSGLILTCRRECGSSSHGLRQTGELSGWWVTQLSSLSCDRHGSVQTATLFAGWYVHGIYT